MPFEIDIRPYLPVIPFLKMKLPPTYNLGGRIIDVDAFIDKITGDGKLSVEDIPIAAAIWFGSQPVPTPPPAPVPVPPVVVSPPVVAPTTPAVPAPGRMGLLAWTEEMFHDWFRGEVAPDADWIPGGHPRLNKILDGTENAPAGVLVRFKAEEAPAQSGKWGAYVIEHVFSVGGVAFVLRSDDGDDSSQPGGDRAHVHRGPRFRNASGWDVSLRIPNQTGEALKVTYFARSPEDPTLKSAVSSFTVGHG